MDTTMMLRIGAGALAAIVLGVIIFRRKKTA
jgi:hypothetical protein